MYPEAVDNFFAKEADIDIKFNKTPTGKIIGLTLYQEGGKFEGKKVD